MNCAQDAEDGFINAINTGNLTDCDDITVSGDAVDRLIDVAIDAVKSTDCIEDAAGGQISTIDVSVLMNSVDLQIKDDAVDRLITTTIDADVLITTPIESTYCADTNVSDYAFC